MRSSRVAVLLATALAAGCAETRPVRRAPIELARYSGWYRVLPGGLRLVVYQRPGARHFHLGASYLGGSSADPAGQEGTALLASRLAVRARPGGQALADRILAAGSRSTVEATRIDLVFEQEGRLAALRTAVEVERDRLRDPLAGVTEEEFLEAREALALELTLEQEQGADEVHLAALLAEILPGSPGARPRGTPASVRGLTFEGLRAWAKTHLSPARLVLVITAPGRPEEVAQGAVEALGEATLPGESRPAEAPAAPEPPPAAAKLPVVRETSDGPRLWLAWILPEEVAARAVTLETAVGLLRHVAGERLRREDLWPATRGEPVAHAIRLPGRAVVALGVGLRADKDAEPVAEALRGEVGSFVTSYRSSVVLTLAGSILRRLAFLRGEDVNVAEAARWLRDTGQADYLAGTQAQLGGMAGGGLPAAAAAALAAPAARALLVLPLGPAAPDVEAASFVAAAAAEPRSLAPAPGPDAVRALLSDPAFALHRRTLPNGLEVVVAPVGEHPTAVARLVVRVPVDGSNGNPAGLHELAMAAAEKDWSLLGDYHCPGVARHAAAESVGFETVGYAAELPAAIEALGCVSRSTSVDRSFGDRRDAAVKRLRGREPHAGELALGALYGTHPYAARRDPEALAATRSGTAERWLERVLRPDRATLIIAGKVQPGPELDQLVDRALGGWRARGEPLAEPPAPAAAAPSKALLVPGRRAAALILAAARLPGSDREAGQAVGHLLEDRLRAALPPEVIAQVRLVETRHDRVLSAALFCAPSRAAAAAATFLAEVRRLGRGEVPPEDAARARWQVARALAPRHDTAAAAVADLAFAVERGLPLEDGPRVESAAALTAERVAGEARRLAAGHEVVVILGDRNLAPALEAAGLAVEVVEPAPEAKRKR